jgi:hypothetical protein
MKPMNLNFLETGYHAQKYVDALKPANAAAMPCHPNKEIQYPETVLQPDVSGQDRKFAVAHPQGKDAPTEPVFLTQCSSTNSFSSCDRLIHNNRRSEFMHTLPTHRPLSRWGNPSAIFFNTAFEGKVL